MTSFVKTDVQSLPAFASGLVRNFILLLSVVYVTSFKLHFLVHFLCFPYVVPCDLYPQNLMWLVLCSSIINRILFNFSQSNVVVHKPKCIKLRQKALHVTFII